MKPLEISDDRDFVRVELGLSKKGYKNDFRVLDRYTMLNTRSGERLLPNDVLRMHRSFVLYGTGTMVLYRFFTRKGEKGYFLQISGTAAAVMAESYYLNVDMQENVQQREG
jgi:hypothetical protein